jgi:hypothetical protein
MKNYSLKSPFYGRVILPILLTITGVFTSVPALANDWVRVKTDGYNDTYYVNVKTIKKQGRIRYFFSNIVFGYPPQLDNGQIIPSATFYLSVDCQSKVFRVHFVRLLDENGRTYEDLNYGSYFRSGRSQPGSGSDASVNYVCSR